MELNLALTNDGMHIEVVDTASGQRTRCARLLNPSRQADDRSDGARLGPVS
jgi:hypothetical protein